MDRKKVLWIVLWAVLVVLTGYMAFFRGPWMGYGYGYGPWHGAWPGWRVQNGWEQEWGPHRWRDWQGMGWNGGNWGMMSGACGGAVPGMALGMPGHGMMMPWFLADLTPEQSEKISQLQVRQMSQNRLTMQQIWENQAQLARLYAADKRDWNAIREASQKIFELQRSMQDAAIETQRKIDALLTDAQRRQITQP